MNRLFRFQINFQWCPSNCMQQNYFLLEVKVFSSMINQQIILNCLLTLQFIQPYGQAPVRTFHIAISNYAARFIHAAMFYLHQHLLLKFHTPRFSESDSNFHFKNYSPHRKVWNSAEPISLQDMYLYIPKEKGPAGNVNNLSCGFLQYYFPFLTVKAFKIGL